MHVDVFLGHGFHASVVRAVFRIVVGRQHTRIASVARVWVGLESVALGAADGAPLTEPHARLSDIAWGRAVGAVAPPADAVLLLVRRVRAVEWVSKVTCANEARVDGTQPECAQEENATQRGGSECWSLSCAIKR